jgi:DNA-binding IclR family transcriptional regulator
MDSTLLKGLSVLERVAMSEEPRGVTELAEELPLTKSNVHRILKTLEAAGYLTRDETTRRYKLTLKLWELGLSVVSKMDLRVQASPWLKGLSETTRETVHLSVLDGDEVIYIDKVDSSEPIQAYSHVGGRAPAHCVATGKALLSCRSNAFLNDLATRLKPYSEHTITDPARVLAEMEQIRKQGFALNLGEWREGVWGVAALIRDARGEVAGAVGISGPSFRIKERNIDNYVGPVMAAAEDISSRLGYRKNLLVRST